MNEKNFILMRLDTAHLEEVHELECLCFAEPWSVNALNYLLSKQAIGVVCIADGRVVAYGGMALAPYEGQITNIAVHPEHRRRGYGAAVVNALIKEAEHFLCETVSLEVRVSNEGAIALYEGLGFSVAGRRKGFYRNPVEDALVMIRNLQS